MDKEKVSGIAIIIVLIGLLMLFVISDMIKPEAKRVCGIDKELEGKKVSVAGFVKDIGDLSTGGKSFVLYDEKCEVGVVYFGDDLVIQNKEKVIIVGIIQTYKGSLELVADRVMSVKEARKTFAINDDESV